MAIDIEHAAPAEDLDVGDPLWSLARVAKYMDVSLKQVRRWEEQGQLHAVRFSPKLIRVRKSVVESFINAHYRA